MAVKFTDVLSAVPSPMALASEDLNSTDSAILDELREGRITAAYMANNHDLTGGDIRSRLTLLAHHDHIQAIGGGLYELLDDPREE